MSNNETEPKSFLSKCINAIYALPFVIAFLLIATWFEGYTLSVLWEWFVVPAMHVPVITSWQGAGLMVILAFAKYRYGDGVATGGTLLGAIVYMLHPFYIGAMVLGVGFVIKCFI